MVDDLRQQRRQAHVAANLQAPAGEQFLDIGQARHDPEEVLFRHLDGDVGAAVAAGLGATAGLDLGPVGLVRAEHELEDAFDTYGAGIGEQLAQDGLQVHGGHSCGFLVLAGNEGLEQKFRPRRRVIDRRPSASRP